MDDQGPYPLPPIHPTCDARWRSLIPFPPAKRRKISTSATSFDAGLFKKQHVSQSALNDTHHLEEANHLCSQYNRLIPFVHGRHGSVGKGLAPYPSAWAFQEGAEEIHNVVRDTYQRLELGVQSLRRQMEQFSDVTRPLNRWYECGYLFSLQLRELVELLGRTDVANDIDYYIGHVNRIIPRAFKQSQTEDELNDCMNHTVNAFPTHVPAALAKAVALIQPIIDRGRDREVFHLFVLLKTEIRRIRPRVRDLKLNEAHQTLDKVMGAFAAQIPIDKSARSHILGVDGHLNVRLELQDVHWRQLDSVNRQSTQYWDFASAARTLKTSYTKKLCVGKGYELSYYARRNRQYNPGRDTCFHTRTFELLDWLQTKAWSEIRARVFQAVGRYLPAEITEDIFEFALVAEGISLHPPLEEKVPVSAPDSPGLESQPPRHEKRLKAEYRCWYVERMRGRSSGKP